MKSTFILPILSTLSALFWVPSVLGHGYVAEFGIDGETYTGNVPNGQTNPSPIRQIDDPSPVKGANNPDIVCGPGAPPASLVVDAMPGSTLTYDWEGADGSNWPHNTGPMITYMASCGDTPCNELVASQAQWFKIDQVGRDSSGDWVQQQLMDGQTFSTQIPENLAPGGYLIRHEIIALHLAQNPGGAEFYPSCQQVNVGGSQTGVPSPEELVTFPGAYSDTDPGILDDDVFNSNVEYIFPGPPVAQLAASSGTDSGDDDDDTPTSSASGGSSSVSPTGSSYSPSPSATNVSGGVSDGDSSCSLQRRSVTKRSKTKRSKKSKRNNSATIHDDLISPPKPRHISRVMARLVHGNSNEW